MMNNKIFYYLLKCPRSRLVVSLAKFLISSHEWNYEYGNHSFLTEKTRNNFKRESFVSLEKLYSYSFLRERIKYIPYLCGFRGERSQNISLVVSLREISLREREKNYLFIFNSFKTPTNCSPIFSH